MHNVLARMPEHSFWLSYLAGSSSTVLLECFLLQGLLAIVAMFVSTRLLPSIYKGQRFSTSVYLFMLSLVIPFGGLFICVTAISLAYRFPLKIDAEDIGEVSWPAFESSLVARIRHGGGGRLRVQLDNVNAPVAERMTALLAMQTMPKRTASPILRGLLRDSVEDVRLLMYGMLDGAEKDITQKIHAELPKLAALSEQGNDQSRCEVNSRLAHYYWELIYQNLVQDDIYLYTAEQVDHYARTALAFNPDDASLWYMRGRLALTRRQPEEAEVFLQNAAQNGFPNDRLLPFVAECAYLNKNYSRVRAALNAFENQSTLPLLQPLQRYWTS